MSHSRSFPASPSRRSLLAAAGSASLLAACGFHLRGVRDLPFSSLYINANKYSELTAQIRRAITAQTHTQVADEIKAADAVLDITENRTEKVILSLNSAGRVREYQLRQRFSFKVRTPDNDEIAGHGDYYAIVNVQAVENRSRRELLVHGEAFDHEGEAATRWQRGRASGDRIPLFRVPFGLFTPNACRHRANHLYRKRS